MLESQRMDNACLKNLKEWSNTWLNLKEWSNTWLNLKEWSNTWSDLKEWSNTYIVESQRMEMVEFQGMEYTWLNLKHTWLNSRK